MWWISKSKLKGIRSRDIGLGYRLGFQAGRVDVMNRVWHLLYLEASQLMREALRPLSLMDKQIITILQKKRERGTGKGGD